jgi:hypothetical protein
MALNTAAVEPARQQMDLQAPRYWKGPLWTLQLGPSPGPVPNLFGFFSGAEA